jgi:hypothetical protein
MFETKAHPSALPLTVAGALRRSPAPFALTRHHTINATAATGVTSALRVKRWRIVCRRG